MSFLKSGLNFAERFLDDLDKKAEGARSQKASASTAAQPVDAGGPSVFTRRSLQAVDATVTRQSSADASLPARVSLPADSGVPVRSLSSSGRSDAEVKGGSSTGDGGGDRHAGEPSSTVSDRGEQSLGHGEAVGGADTPKARSGSGGEDAATITALRDALQDREVRLMEATAAVEALTRNNSNLSADLDDMEAELRTARQEVERVKRREESLEKQIKDAYHEVRCLCVPGVWCGRSGVASAPFPTSAFGPSWVWMPTRAPLSFTAIW